MARFGENAAKSHQSQALEVIVAPPARSVRGGWPRVDDFAVINGILFVLVTGIPWEDLPKELGFGCGMTCWRRLRDWQAQGVWDRLHLALLTRLRQHDQIDWGRVSIDAARRQETGPNLTDQESLAASGASLFVVARYWR